MRNPNRQTTFSFKQFELSNCKSAMKVSTDGVLIGAWAFQATEPMARQSRILDVGCGTGLLVLMMAQRFPNAIVSGVEIDEMAASEAKENFMLSPWGSRLLIYNEDFDSFSRKAAPGSFDYIISNPPFFTNGALSPFDARCMARHENSLTLDLLFEAGARLLAPEGRLAFITSSENRQRIEFLSALNRLHVTRLCSVKTVSTKPPRRVLVELCKSGCPMQPPCDNSGLTLRDSADGGYSKEYVSLVEPFYTKI